MEWINNSQIQVYEIICLFSPRGNWGTMRLLGLIMQLIGRACLSVQIFSSLSFSLSFPVKMSKMTPLIVQCPWTICCPSSQGNLREYYCRERCRTWMKGQSKKLNPNIVKKPSYLWILSEAWESNTTPRRKKAHWHKGNKMWTRGTVTGEVWLDQHQ